MKKLVFILVIFAVFALWYMKAPIVSVYLSNKLKVPISIKKIDFSRTHTVLQNFKVKNPRRQRNKVAFFSRNIDIFYSWKELKDTPAIIDNIEISDALLNVECKNPTCKSNNWTEIISNIPKRENGKEFIIKKLKIDKLKVEIYSMGMIPGSRKEINVSNIELYNIKSSEGFPTKELVAAIFKDANILDFIKEILIKQNVLEKIFQLLGEEEKSKEGV